MQKTIWKGILTGLMAAIWFLFVIMVFVDCCESVSINPEPVDTLLVIEITGIDSLWDVELNDTPRCGSEFEDCSYCNIGAQKRMAVGRSGEVGWWYNSLLGGDLASCYELMEEYDLDHNDLEEAYVKVWCWYDGGQDAYLYSSPMLRQPVTAYEKVSDLDGRYTNTSWRYITDYSPSAVCLATYQGECIIPWNGIKASADYDTTVCDTTHSISQPSGYWMRYYVTETMRHHLKHQDEQMWAVLHTDHLPYSLRDMFSVESAKPAKLVVKFEGRKKVM